MVRNAHTVVFVAVAFTSLSSILVRLSVAPSLVIAAWRMIIATAILSAVPLVRPAGGRITGRTVLLVVVGGIFLALHFATWITSLSMTSVVHSTVLVTIHPIIVLVGSAVFLHHRLQRPRLVATLVALAGAVLLSAGGSARGMQPTVAGDLLALAGAVAVAGYIVIGSYVRRTLTAGWYNFLVHLVAAVVLMGIAAAFRQPLAPYPWREFAIFAALAVFCTILGHSLVNWALKFVSAPDVSLAILLEPVFASVLAALLFGEIPGFRTVLGALVVLGALGFVQISRRD
jgi:drug/metabolite transporter (DMT)-like permease